MPPEPPDLTVVVPTYNERPRIAELVSSAFAACDAARVRLELVIVDDNSPDGTGALADELATRHRVRVVHRAGKLGLGSAVVEGFRAASADVLGVMDADFSHPPAMLPKMYAAFLATDADLLVASRYIPGGGTSNWPWRRRLMSRLGGLLARPLSPVRDATSGFFMIKRSIAQSAEIKAAGFKICLEMLMRGSAHKLVEVPYIFDDRLLGESKMTMKEGRGYLTQLADLYLLGRRAKKFEYRQLGAQELERLAAARQ